MPQSCSGLSHRRSVLRRLARTGSLGAVRRKKGNKAWFRAIPLEERLWSRIRKTKTCWVWMGNVSNLGYGSVYISGKNYRATRVVWCLLVGEIPNGMLLCHHCDNPVCVNPKHLFLGTQKDNMVDCSRKWRNGVRRKSPGNWMRRARHKARITTPEMCKLIGLGQSQMYDIEASRKNTTDRVKTIYRNLAYDDAHKEGSHA